MFKKIFLSIGLLFLSLAIIIFVGFDTSIITTESINIKNIKDERAEITIPIIMYHSINSNPAKSNKYVITPQELERDIVYLKEHGYTTVFIEDIINYVRNGEKLPQKPIALTFDDGFYNNYLNAYPLIKKYNEKAIISVIGAETEKFSKTVDTNENYASLSWENIKEMNESGYIEFLNHSYNMHSLNNGRKGTKKNKNEITEEYQKIFTSDAEKTQRLFEENIGIRPICYTYPFGAISEESYKCIIDIGFLASLDACDGKFTAKKFDEGCLYRIPRYIRTDKITLENIIEGHFTN